MDDLGRQLKKGILDILVLKLLDQGEMYGYELMQRLAEAGGGYFTMREGTLYPILYRLEDAGRIKSSWDKTERRGVPRKYYTLTDEGKHHLDEAKAELSKFITAIKKVMEVF